MASATENQMLQYFCSFLSGTVIISCLLLKVPQIFLVFKGRSSKGLSFSSVLLELSGYSIILTYHCAMSYPLSTYLEYCFLVPQDLVLIMSILQYNGGVKTRALAVLVVYLFICYSVAFRIVPEAVLQIVINCVTPLSVSSKLLQMVTLLRTKDAGNVSATTWSLAAYCTLARSITTFVQIQDVAVLMNFSLSFCLNVAMTTLILYYRTRKEKKLD